MRSNRKVHIVPSRERHFEFGTRPQYIQYSNGVSSPWKGAPKIKLEMPIQHGGRERKTQDNQPTEYSHLLQPRLIPQCLLQPGTLDHGNFVLVTYLGENNPASCRFGVNPECRANLALNSWSHTAGFQVHLPPLQTMAGTTSIHPVFICGLPQT